jgi:hypothetical protein
MPCWRPIAFSKRPSKPSLASRQTVMAKAFVGCFKNDAKLFIDLVRRDRSLFLWMARRRRRALTRLQNIHAAVGRDGGADQPARVVANQKCCVVGAKIAVKRLLFIGMVGDELNETPYPN